MCNLNKKTITLDATLVQEVHVIIVRLLGAGFDTSSAQLIAKKSHIAAFDALSSLSLGKWHWVDWAVEYASSCWVLAECTLATVCHACHSPVVCKRSSGTVIGAKFSDTIGPSKLLLPVKSDIPKTLVQTDPGIIITKGPWRTVFDASICLVETIKRGEKGTLLDTSLGAVVFIRNYVCICDWIGVIWAVDDTGSGDVVGKSISADMTLEFAVAGFRVSVVCFWAVLCANSGSVQAKPSSNACGNTTSGRVLCV